MNIKNINARFKTNFKSITELREYISTCVRKSRNHMGGYCSDDCPVCYGLYMKKELKL